MSRGPTTTRSRRHLEADSRDELLSEIQCLTAMPVLVESWRPILSEQGDVSDLDDQVALHSHLAPLTNDILIHYALILQSTLESSIKPTHRKRKSQPSQRVAKHENSSCSRRRRPQKGSKVLPDLRRKGTRDRIAD